MVWDLGFKFISQMTFLDMTIIYCPLSVTKKSTITIYDI